MKIVFENGNDLNCIDVIEREELCIGSSRHVLTVICEPNAVSIDALNMTISDADNTVDLLVIGTTIEEKVEDGELVQTPINVEKNYEGYTMKLAVGIEKVLVQPETPDSAAVYADMLVFKLGRPTFIEQKLAALGITG